ncbi:MAG TPA: acyl-CoA dehydrogenase family protein, partial [Methylomirabilota bacterium]|nr:acyl-CoA dehydrogenase family protein [Methylomirabilota bacterium]
MTPGLGPQEADGAGAPWVERARALGGLVEASAEAAERDRRLPEALVAALHDAGLFRLLLPRSLDGAEVDPPTFMRVVEELARHDA